MRRRAWSVLGWGGGAREALRVLSALCVLMSSLPYECTARSNLEANANSHPCHMRWPRAAYVMAPGNLCDGRGAYVMAPGAYVIAAAPL